MQLPTIKRAAPQGEVSPGRLDGQAPNIAGAMAPQNQAINNFVKEGVDLYQRQEKFAGDTAAAAASLEYNNAIEGLYSGKGGFKYTDPTGDPTGAFDNLNQKQKEIRDQIYEKYKNLSDYGKQALEQKLSTVDSSFHSKKIATYGDLYDKFETNVANETVKTEQNNFVESIKYTDFKNPAEVGGLEKHIAAIIDTRYNTALKKGIAQRDADGKIITSRSTDLAVRKDLSDTVYNALEILNASGNIEGAKVVKEKYGQWLEPSREKEIIKQQRDAEIKFTSQGIVDKLKYSDSEYASSQIDKIKDPEIREQALKDFATMVTTKDRLSELSQKRNYESAAEIIGARNREGKPFVDVNDMLKDPALSQFYRRSDAKQKKALEQMIVQPETSSPEVLERMYNQMSSGGFTGMSFAEYNQAAAGLSKADRSRFDSIYTSANSQTEAEKTAMYKTMGSALQEMMQAQGYIDMEYGRMTDTERRKYNQAFDELDLTMQKMPPKGFSIQDQRNYVREFVAKRLKKEAFFKPPEAVGARRVAPDLKRPSVGQKNVEPAENLREFSMQEMVQWGAAYKKANPNLVGRPTVNQVKEFAAQNKYILPK